MAEPKPKKVVPAKVVEVDHGIEPIDAMVVGDKRMTLGRRLGIFALVILLLFFVINAYIQSSKNGRALRHAATSRAELIHSVSHLSNTIKSQKELIKQLQDAIHIQNKELRKAGFQVVQVPGESSSTPPPSSPPQSTPRGGHSPEPKPKPHPKPAPSPSPTPTSHPNPSPISKAKQQICKLTGICTINFALFIKF